MWVKNKEWLNGKSFITSEEMFGDYTYVINKLGLVLYSDKYFEDTKIFCRSVLDFAVDHDFITWKQAYAILNIRTTAERTKAYRYKPSVSTKYVYRVSSITDKQRDRMCRQLFGDDTHEEELDGYVKCYRDDGSRYFAFPTGNEQLHDYI
jgi:hypothetical protein